MTDTRLETLIARYEAAIFADDYRESRVNQLGRLVEARADHIGYTDHARLMALHTAAERAAARPRLRTFRYHLRDRRYGQIFESNQRMEGTSKSDIRQALAKAWRRDVPSRARDSGFVPFRDVQIIWIED